MLRALEAGVLGTIDCKKSLVHGFSLNKTALDGLAVFVFEEDCLEIVGSTKTACTEPIKTNLTEVELGLLATTKAVLELVEPERGTEFVKVTCGSNVTTVEGKVVGEVPATNEKGANQLNSQRSELETVFEAEGKTSENEKYTSLELSGTLMTKVELKVAGFFGGAASVEGKGVTKPVANGTVELSTKF